jgi:hypothetical protein
MRLPPIVLVLAASCTLRHEPVDTEPADGIDGAEPVAALAVAPLPTIEPAPAPSERLSGSSVAVDVGQRIDAWFQGHGTSRVYVQLDRPMYRPGDAIWLKTWSVASRGLLPDANHAITYELVDPRGLTVQTKGVAQAQGAATNDFVLPADAPGGKWTLRATLPTGEVDERPFVVASYQTPRIRKELDFVREAYGAGEAVEALVELLLPTGEPLADHAVSAMLQVDGQVVAEAELRTDSTGAVFVRAGLPADLRSADGLLTVFVTEGGLTESISRAVPIVLADARLAFFPEGGDLVRGLPGRVYFEATNAHGEPADVAGEVVDDRGAVVATFRSVHDGLGRFAFTPEPGRVYFARITEPAVDQAFALPAAADGGCTLRAFDDLHSEHADLRVAVRCAKPTDVLVAGVQREAVLDVARVHAGPAEDTVVYLSSGETPAQGAVRVTLFDDALAPLAERLVYRHPHADLRIHLSTDRAQYGPRDEVVLTVATTAPDGTPVPAELALAVVDDALIGLADDEEGHILSRLYLEPELVESPEDPGWYFDPEEADAARGLDLVMGTKGWRRFEWTRVWNPEPPAALPASAVSRTEGLVPMAPRGAILPVPLPDDVAGVGSIALDEAIAPVADLPLAAPARELAAAEPWPVEQAVLDPNPAGIAMRGEARGRRGPRRAEWDNAADGLLDALGYLGDGEWGGGGLRQAGYAPVRVFPAPDYREGFTGERSDFRDTVHWAPSVVTDARGLAEVRFYLSDAVTAFRLTAEGVGGGLAGHQEATISSVLPVSIGTRLPVAVSAGDTLLLPVTVTSTRDQVLPVRIDGEFASPLITASSTRGDLTLRPNGTDAHWFTLAIGEGADTARVRLSAVGGELADTVTHELAIVPPGFPRAWSAAGESASSTAFDVPLDDWVPGSLTARVSWSPSPVSTLMTGMEGLIHTPGGCFEQTSSTNWPNVAILAYLEAHDGDPRLRVASSRALDAGYARLTGYQVSAGGFETWGSGPGKEALSAFGLLQFHDMAKVFPVADAILARDAEYLLAQRTGRGGFRNSGESAHGYGSAPADVLDGFITWALVATGHGAALETELAHQAEAARATRDPYVLALAARSITRSYEANLVVESTALAALALMESGGYTAEADKAAQWLIAARRGAGTWGATQATALALDALTEHAERSRRPKADGRFVVQVNGIDVGTLSYRADASEPLVIDGWAHALRPGANHIVLRQERGEPLPYTVDLSWTSVSPSTSPGAELSITTRLSDTEVRMGDTVRLRATIDNRTADVVPSPIARIGLPAGLEAQTWQLEQLQERGQIAFFETRPREITLYWDGLHADEAHEVVLDLVAAVPGTFTGPASSAYPYYDDDELAWAEGLVVRVDR